MLKKDMQDRIRGMLLGVAIGDAFGSPAESKSAQFIYEYFGEIKKYTTYKNRQPGHFTDDTQLTLAVADALLQSHSFNMQIIAEHHVKAFKQSTAGWGQTTKNAVFRLQNNVHWKDSGSIEDEELRKRTGFGNGIIMKITPLVVFNILNHSHCAICASSFYSHLYNLTFMTHKTVQALETTNFHFFMMEHLLNDERFLKSKILDVILEEIKCANNNIYYRMCYEGYMNALYVYSNNDTFESRIPKLKSIASGHSHLTDSNLISIFGNSCYVMESLAFSYALFLRDPSWNAVVCAVNAGGDADTNASIIASMLGAVHGMKVFPKSFIKKLDKVEQIIDTADRMVKEFS